MVNSAGGLRFNQPSQELTHIVMGEPDQGVKVFLDKATHRSVKIYVGVQLGIVFYLILIAL